ncbi:MAG: hypothetical protein OXF89_19205 [Rhodospirillaceae bacterium]|nr:hypothetical protein [Rhodospirillaceae bacterium]MCY4066465.1 hypothetical protein [Rhodospirillaceae bacterium]
MESASAGDRGLRSIAVLAVAAAALLAVAAAIAWLTDSPAAPERLEGMDCRELAAEILEGSEAKRRAALEVFTRKKCL